MTDSTDIDNMEFDEVAFAASLVEADISYQDLTDWLDQYFGSSSPDTLSEEDIIAFVEDQFEYLKQIYHSDYLFTEKP